MDKPVSVVIEAPSGTGKSFLLDNVLKFFPPAAYYKVSSMSPKYLTRTDESLSHRMLVIVEKAGLGEDASYIIRTLLSEGKITHATLDRVSGVGWIPKQFEKEGPTGLILTTTALHLDYELETRILSLPITVTHEETMGIFEQNLCSVPMQPVDPTPWHELQEWLHQQDARVVIPYGKALARAIPVHDSRLHRDTAALASLIKANAFLHQKNRHRDGSGQIIATLVDYQVVRELVVDLFGEQVGATVSVETKQTVNAVKALLKANRHGTVTQLELGMELEMQLGRKIDKGTVSHRVGAAVYAGYLINLQTRRGLPSQLVLGDPLPDEREVLPTVKALSEVISELYRPSFTQQTTTG